MTHTYIHLSRKAAAAFFVLSSHVNECSLNVVVSLRSFFITGRLLYWLQFFKTVSFSFDNLEQEASLAYPL